MSGIVVLGDVMVDVVARLSGALTPSSDTPAVIRVQGGGSAANTAAWLAAAGAAPVLVGRVGDDDRGRAARDELRGLGVDARLASDPGLPTGTCVVLVGPDGERTMAPDAGANDALAPEDLADELLAAGSHLHLSGYALLRSGSRPAALAAIARARDAGMTVSVDPSSAGLLSPSFAEDARGAGLLIPNAEEAELLTGEPEPEVAARALAHGFGEVVVKLGARGALWTDGRSAVGCEAMAVDEVVDSTGAGDAFAAGLLAARAGGADPQEALRAATRLAAEAVSRPGGRP